jgi:hypothetical protein
MSEETQPQPEPQPAPAPTPTKPKKAKQPTRHERFTGAAQALLDAVDSLRSTWEDQSQELEDARHELQSIQQEYEEWLNNLPENLQSSALAEKLSIICDISLLDGIEEPDFDSLANAAQEALDSDPPLGFGRD